MTTDTNTSFKETLYLKINEFIANKVEEQRLKILVNQEYNKIILEKVEIVERPLSKDNELAHYHLYYFFKLYNEATGIDVPCRLNSFYVDESIKNECARNLSYDGAYLECTVFEATGVSAEYSHIHWGEDEEFLLSFLEDIDLMLFVRENKIDTQLVTLQVNGTNIPNK